MLLQIRFILWLGCSVWLSTVSVAQTPAQTLQSADSLSQIGQHREAYALYNRLLFFAPVSEKRLLTEKLARCAEGKGDFADAYALYGSLGRMVDDSETVELLFHQASAGLKGSLYAETSILLERLDPVYLSFEHRLKLSLYSGLCAIKTHQPALADSCFRTLLAFLSQTDQVRLERLLTEYRKKGTVRVKRAERLSLVFPGLGQLYVGKPASAANTIVINGLLATGMVVTSLEYGVVSGVLFWMAPLAHYYIGGANAASALAVQQQADRDQTYYHAFVQLLTRANYQQPPTGVQ